ncbi:MAG: DUF6152 family protein [Steroidobacteraceae bacterium]|jgi:hypothetical protein
MLAMKFTARRSWLMLLALASLPALAHHSFAQFDAERTVELVGTMRALEWQNPHAWIWIDILKSDGTSETWGGEFGGGPSSLPRDGLTRNMIQPGDKITLTLYPARDGSKAGSVAKIQLEDGRTLSFQRPTQAPADSAPAPK